MADRGPNDVHNAAVTLRTTPDIDLTDDVDFYFQYTGMLVVADLSASRATRHHVVETGRFIILSTAPKPDASHGT